MTRRMLTEDEIRLLRQLGIACQERLETCDDLISCGIDVKKERNQTEEQIGVIEGLLSKFTHRPRAGE